MKSGYKFLQECAENSHASAQDSAFWKKVWGLEVPSKVKNFVWRACREALPTRKNLQWRKIVPDGLCDLCKAGEEECSHALFFCSDVQVIWSSEWPWISGLQGSTVKEIFRYAFEENILAFTSWSMWNRRNQLRFKESACPLNQILPLAKERKREFQCLQPTTLKMQHRKHTTWKPPNKDCYKVNYDGAIFEQQGKVGLGVVIRNSNGEVMASMSQLVQLPTTVSQVEAMATRKATEFALEIGFDKIILEGNSEIVYKDLMNNGSSLALHGHLIQDVKVLVPLFSSVCFSHVSRTGNQATHSLARRAILSKKLNVWMEDVPLDILDVIQADFSPP